jgi:hypothetical protein
MSPQPFILLSPLHAMILAVLAILLFGRPRTR